MLSTPTIAQIPTEDHHVLAFRISGHVRPSDVNAMCRVVNEAFERSDRVSLLFELEGDGVEKAVADITPESAIVGMDSPWRVERYAVVGESAAVAAMIGLCDGFVSTEAQTFMSDELAEAWDFVGSEPTGTPAGGIGQAVP